MSAKAYAIKAAQRGRTAYLLGVRIQREGARHEVRADWTQKAERALTFYSPDRAGMLAELVQLWCGDADSSVDVVEVPA